VVKIVSNHNRQDVTYTFTVGRTFPDVQGKLLSVEVNGKELSKLMEKKEIPICAADSSYLAWHGKQAGGILKMLRELFGDK
jgi:hypothetical protein